jgi:hypothetical protein
MDELLCFVDPWNSIGLRIWRRPERNRLVQRLKKIRPRKTIPWRRGYLVLRELFGEKLDEQDTLAIGYAYQRLLAMDWVTGFRCLGFFTEEEVRDYALLAGPPQDSILGHFWYGLLGGETPREIERIYRRLVAAERRRRALRAPLGPYAGDLLRQAARFPGENE